MHETHRIAQEYAELMPKSPRAKLGHATASQGAMAPIPQRYCSEEIELPDRWKPDCEETVPATLDGLEVDAEA